MNKSDLVLIISEQNNVSKACAERMLKSTLEAIKEALVAGERVQLVGFGSFEVKWREGHIGRNPRTKEPIDIKPSRRVVFGTSAAMRESLNSGKN